MQAKFSERFRGRSKSIAKSMMKVGHRIERARPRTVKSPTEPWIQNIELLTFYGAAAFLPHRPTPAIPLAAPNRSLNAER
jgi:hypothetical protein